MFPVRIKSKNIIGIWAGVCSLPQRVEPKAIMTSPDKLLMGKEQVMWVPVGLVVIKDSEGKGVLIPASIDDIEVLFETPSEFNEEADKVLGEEENS